MSFPSKSQMDSCTDSLDFVDIREFSNRCEIYKNEMKQNKDNIPSLDLDMNFDQEEENVLPLVNTSLVFKWRKVFEKYAFNFDDSELKEVILSDDATFNSDFARKEAALARRIARCRLSAAEPFKTDSGCISNYKCLKINIPPVSTNPAMSLPGNASEATFDSSPVSPSDIILTISVYPGGKSSLLHSIHRQEIELKASDSLQALVDGIYCLSRRVASEIITDPCQCAVFDSSTFLFMEGTFYDEELDAETHYRPSDIYYEAYKAIENTSSTARFLFPDPSAVKQASLKLTQWIDLKVRLNTPYLYAHLGGCEHVFVITQIRATSLSEDNVLVLPRVSQALRFRRRKCRICEVYAGTKMLVNDKLLPENPCVVCDKCLEGFHGSEQNWYKDFEVFPYYHEA